VNPDGIVIRHGSVHDDPGGYCAECQRIDKSVARNWTAQQDSAPRHCPRLHLDPATKRRLWLRASEQIDVLGLNHDQGAIVLGVLRDIIDDEIDADAERRFANASIDPDPLRAIAEQQQREERQQHPSEQWRNDLHP
jgi:hypothetical protein